VSLLPDSLPYLRFTILVMRLFLLARLVGQQTWAAAAKSAHQSVVPNQRGQQSVRRFVDPAAQARQCFEISRTALQQLGAGPEDVIRTRITLTRIEDWKLVAEVHGEFFREIRPVNTIMQVSRFIDPDWLIETEVDAVVP
jgi:enamine deaminase RidA (YjgF/YER057c/UK114 family)